MTPEQLARAPVAAPKVERSATANWRDRMDYRLLMAVTDAEKVGAVNEFQAMYKARQGAALEAEIRGQE